MKILVIDDQRIFNFPEAVHCTTMQDGLRELYENGPWDEVWLDHDLGAESEGSGSDIVRRILDREPTVATYIVHSMNPVGNQYMVNSLRDAGFDVRIIMWTKATMDVLLDYKAMEKAGRDPLYAGPMRGT